MWLVNEKMRISNYCPAFKGMRVSIVEHRRRLRILMSVAEVYEVGSKAPPKNPSKIPTNQKRRRSPAPRPALDLPTTFTIHHLSILTTTPLQRPSITLKNAQFNPSSPSYPILPSSQSISITAMGGAFRINNRSKLR